MRGQVKKACVATVAAAAAVALTTGLTSPMSAAEERTGNQSPAGGGAPGKGRPGPGPQQRLTLITGDRVVIDAKGRVARIEPGEGRKNIPIQTQTHGGRTYTVPYDARQLIAEGRLDRRLFDIGELRKAANLRGGGNGLRAIVGYGGDAAGRARTEVRGTGGTQVRRALGALNADAISTPRQDAGELWSALTRTRGGGARTTASGISRIWLDGVRRSTLDRSTAQIGAPKLWNRGIEGQGVTIAVLDTGIDDTHPDLRTQVVGAKNFTSSPDTKDRDGHGTHVASTVAGTGAKSGGKYKGVAPKAKLLNSKVLDDNGAGEDSGIIAGIDWAVAQGAQILNLSLGGGDTPQLDPLEAHVNKVTAEKGVLFAIAAGNSGPGSGTVNSPGSADAALTVGAVDDQDRPADFSSVGPRAGDGAVKPDVTAPGVDTTAAAADGSTIARQVGQNPPGYMSISGTSMATPHVAGAAALLKQQHPTWRPAELKGALVASAEGGPYSVFQQGSGRVSVDKAVGQRVIAEPVSVGFGVQQWPHTDDLPVTKKITYRNLGTQDVTLDLTVTGTGPQGRPAPAGFFTVGTPRVTVPAGGTATADVTVNTRLGGTADGAYSAVVVATGGGQTVRTAASVDREIESYDVTFRHIGRDGKPSEKMLSTVAQPGGNPAHYVSDPSGTATVRLPKGRFIVDTTLAADPLDSSKGFDWLVRPRLDVTRNMTLTVDARAAKPVDIRVPAANARQTVASAYYEVNDPADNIVNWLHFDSFKNIRTQHLGPQITDGSLSQTWTAQFMSGPSTEYNVSFGGKAKQLATGLTKRFTANEFATVKAGLGSSAKTPGKEGELQTQGTLPGIGFSVPGAARVRLPGTRTVHLSTGDGVQWEFQYLQLTGRNPGDRTLFDAYYSIPSKVYRAGKTYSETFNTAVHAPALSPGTGIFREGNQLWGDLPVFADGQGHTGYSDYASVRTTLHRGTTKVGQNDDPLIGAEKFTVGAPAATYTLKTSVTRAAAVAAAASRIDASWTFRSAKPAGDASVKVPASVARFGAKTGLDSKAKAGATQLMPVTVQGPAAGRNLKSLTVHVSYDLGKTWKKLTVKKGEVTVRNPAKGKGVSLRAAFEDKQGNKGAVTVYNAYFGK
ncbi:S8 family peptidase [Streptomyces sp. NPDC004726]